jgi:hypothetical protein
MKTLIFLSLSLASICLSVFAASADFPINSKFCENSCQELRVVNICSLSDQELNEIMEGHHPEIAVEFSPQTSLPISFFLKGDLVNLVETEGKFGTVEIKQSFYVRLVDQELILSTNLTEWKLFFEFLTGNTSVALSIHDGQPSIVVGAETNRRL